MKKDCNHREENKEVSNNVDPAIENAWIDEAQRRMKEYKAGEVEMIPGEEVMERLKSITGE